MYNCTNWIFIVKLPLYAFLINFIVFLNWQVQFAQIEMSELYNKNELYKRNQVIQVENFLFLI